MIDCMIHDVPFPAYETFEDRAKTPRRFFLYFDKFFRAGRHNKELWTAAIETNGGRNNITFGSCIFEAHLRTTIRENYFSWLYQALSSPKIIPVLDKAEDFQTEYDFEVLPEKLACNCPLISDLPPSCEYRYNEERKMYQMVSVFGTSNEAAERVSVVTAERLRLQELVDSKKEERKETLRQLRQMVDNVRPQYISFSREKKNEFNMQAKKNFRLFLDPIDKENGQVGSTTTPPAKKKRKTTPSSSQNKCRVPKEKLDAFSALRDQLLQESVSGLRNAWEVLYKNIMYEIMFDQVQDTNHVSANQLLGELSTLEEDNWRTQKQAASSTASVTTEFLSAATSSIGQNSDDVTEDDSSSSTIPGYRAV